MRVQAVAATEPTVMVPLASELSLESDGEVPQLDNVGAVDEAAKCPYWSTWKRHTPPATPHTLALKISFEVVVAKIAKLGPVVEAALTLTVGEPKRSKRLKLPVLSNVNRVVVAVAVEEPIANNIGEAAGSVGFAWRASLAKGDVEPMPSLPWYVHVMTGVVPGTNPAPICRLSLLAASLLFVRPNQKSVSPPELPPITRAGEEPLVFVLYKKRLPVLLFSRLNAPVDVPITTLERKLALRVVVAPPEIVRPPCCVPLPIVVDAVMTNPEEVDIEVALIGVNGYANVAQLAQPNAPDTPPIKLPNIPE